MLYRTSFLLCLLGCFVVQGYMPSYQWLTQRSVLEEDKRSIGDATLKQLRFAYDMMAGVYVRYFPYCEDDFAKFSEGLADDTPERQAELLRIALPGYERDFLNYLSTGDSTKIDRACLDTPV